MSLGGKIQELRKQSNLSQEQLAEKLTVSRQAISKWELDQSIPDTDKIIQLSSLFQVSTDYLLKEDMTTPLQQTVNSDTDKKSIALDVYKQFLGRWVKILLDDRAYGGLYQVAMMAIDKNHILFQDKKGKKGILTTESIISISDADIYKKNPGKVPAIVLEDMTGNSLFEYLQGKHCQIHFICKSIFTTPQGCFDALIEKITNDEVLINNHGKKSIIKQEKILMMAER